MEEKKKTDEKKKKRGSRFWLRGLALWLTVMLAFTAASRIADSITIAKANTEQITGRRIRHTVSASGRIEQNRELAVVTEPDILIESVAVREGESVEEGELLLQLDLESISGQIDAVNRDIQSLELQNQALSDGRSLEDAKRETDIMRAQEDYEETVRENEAAAADARRELREAQANLEQAEQELREAQTNLEQAKQEPETKDLTQEQANPGTGAPDLEVLQAYAAQKQSAYDACKASLSEKEAALEAALQTQKTEEKAAARTLEDANTPQAPDHTAEINQLTIEEYRTKLQKLERLRESKGRVTALKKGTVTGLYVSVGQKTTDTAAVTVSDESAGYRFVAKIQGEDVSYVTAGDAAELKSAGKTVQNCTVTSVEAGENGETYTVSVQLDKDSFRPGESAVMNVIRESDEYPYTVPLTALLQEDRKTFILVVDMENTVLGQQYVARKVEVTVLDKNSDYAAIESAALDSDSQVITDTDRYVEAGQRIRLIEN